jgi:putative phosphoesterase
VSERLAVLGDVHCKAQALEAVLAAAEAAGIGRGLCTGDLVLRGSDPQACVTRIRELGWPAVQGNTDRKVAERATGSRAGKRPPRPGSRSWTRERLSEASVSWLAGLPPSRRLLLGRWRVLLTHGEPDDPTAALADVDTPAAELAGLAAELAVDCVVFGHTHRPMVRTAGGCLFVNPGSVGEGTADEPYPRWAWLLVEDDGISARLERVEAPLAPPRAR